MSKRPADGALPTFIFMSYFSQASLFPLTLAPAPQQGQLTVSTSYMNVTLSHIRPVILKKADERGLYRTTSTFSQKRRDNRASKITLYLPTLTP